MIRIGLDEIERILKKFTTFLATHHCIPPFPLTPEIRILFALPYVSGKAIGQENLLLYTIL